jgi:ANTAR domain-containing protein
MSIPQQRTSNPAPTPIVAVRTAPAPENGAGDETRWAQEFVAVLTAACVPALCDDVRFDLIAQDGPPASDAIEQPHREVLSEQSIAPGCIAFTVHSGPAAGEPFITGTVSCRWDDQDRPSGADVAVARLVAEQAVARMRIAGMARTIQVQRARAANLEEALATNREIGQAIGILMAIHQITADQAFDKLRSTSQHLHRKLRSIAADVVETGTLAGASTAGAT